MDRPVDVVIAAHRKFGESRLYRHVLLQSEVVQSEPPRKVLSLVESSEITFF